VEGGMGEKGEGREEGIQDGGAGGGGER